MIEPPTVATTRLDHIEANLAAIRRHVGDRAVLAAVKADAYGHGAVEVARHLQSTGAVDQFGVATVGEGIELRRAGITLPILKLSVARGPEVVAAVEHDLALIGIDEASIGQAAAPGPAPPPGERRSASEMFHPGRGTTGLATRVRRGSEFAPSIRRA